MLKKINDANSGVKRPLRVSDIQELWTALTDINGIDAGSTPVILSGFNDKGDGNLSAGVIAMDGIMYYHPDVSGSRIAIGANVYGKEISGVDERVFEDATTQDFSFNMIANTAATGEDLGLLTLARVAQIRAGRKTREVTGVLEFTLYNNTTPTLTFTPDGDIGDNLVLSSVVTTNYAKFSITDAFGVRMNKSFSIVPQNTTDMISLIPNYPDVIFASQYGDTEDIHFYFAVGIVDPPARYSYRLTILFDV